MKDINIPAGYKSTDFGVIPEDWITKPLKAVSSMNGRIGWQGLKQEEFTTNNSDPFLITGMNFKDGKIRWNEVYHIPEKRYQEAKNIQLQEDDILITKDGTIGKLLYVDNIPFPGKASLNSHLLVFRPLNNAYDPKFLFYQLSSKQFLNYVDLNKSGSTFFGITQEAIGNYNACLPSLPEQKAIARVLSDVDELIIECDSLLAKKRDIKQGTMQQLLTGKQRLPGFSGEWEVETLKELGTWKGGGTPSKKNNTYWNGNIPWVSAKDFHGITITKTQDYITEKAINESSTTLIQKNSILFVTRSSILRNYLPVEKNAIDVTINQDIKALIVRESIFFVDYLIQSIKHFSPEIKKSSVKTGTTVESIDFNGLKRFSIPIPPTLPEQKAIAEILSDMDAEIEALEKKRDKYKAIKQGMMQELLTGRIRLID